MSGVQREPDQPQHDDAAQEREQVAPALPDDRDQHQQHGHDEHRPARRDAIDAARSRREPARPEAGERPQHGGIGAVGEALHPCQVDRREQPGDGDRTRQQPGATGGTDVAGKRGRFTRRSTPATCRRGGRPGVAASDAVHRSLGGCARTVRHEAHDAHVRTVGRRDDVTLSSPAPGRRASWQSCSAGPQRGRTACSHRSLSTGDGIAARWPDERPPSPVDGLGTRGAAVDDR